MVTSSYKDKNNFLGIGSFFLLTGALYMGALYMGALYMGALYMGAESLALKTKPEKQRNRHNKTINNLFLLNFILCPHFHPILVTGCLPSCYYAGAVSILPQEEILF